MTVYQCTNCNSPFETQYINDTKNENLNGILSCSSCQTSIPIVNGIKYFTEADIIYSQDPFSNYHRLSVKIQDKKESYKEFINQKIAKELIDPYSAFQPFNESSRSFYPFIVEIKEKILKPGDIILDTWCRTGWTAYFLSALFPEQKILSVWEGNKDVLGYQGFDYWLSPERRPDNLEVIFTDLNYQLPLKDDVVKLVYGLDTLHRYDQVSLIYELLRVTSSDGVILWPHVHLTNNDPVPFFERGEKQLHGLDYAHYLDKILSAKERVGFVVSEPEMFKISKETKLKSTPNTEDYNALIGILPKTLRDFTLMPYAFEVEEPSRLFIMANPYLKIDLNQAKVSVDRNYLNGAVGKMMDRHPIYDRKMGAADGFQLTENQTKALYLSTHNYSFAEIANLLSIDNEVLMSELKDLVEKEIVHILPLSISAMNLQAFHSAKCPVEDTSNHTLSQLRLLSDSYFKDQPILINTLDSSELQKEDVNYLIQKIQSRFLKSGTSNGDKIIITSKPHFEAVLIFWAASEMGIEVCILSSEMPAKVKHQLIKELNPKMVFTDEVIYGELKGLLSEYRLITFDEEAFSYSEEDLFSSWLEEGEQPILNEVVRPTPESIAAILFTSGTTGLPKGIRLSHGALYRSGALLSQTYQWCAGDRLLMVAELDSMSGLRNTCIATQFKGTTLVVPNFTDDPHIFSLVESIKQQQITILTATPALIKQFIQLGKRIKSDISTLRQVICTGGNLTKDTINEFKNIFEIKVINYYGLTETTGLCIGELENDLNNVTGSIGKSIDSVAQVVDNDLKLLAPGEVGRLRVFNDRLMSGYLKPDDCSNLSIKNGWLYTGDWAVQDEDGNFFLKGRERDIIKNQAGNIVYLSEVEQCLATHSKVKDAAICSEQNESGEYLSAFVIPNDDFAQETNELLKSELKQFVSNELGASKVPVEIFFTHRFISNSRGKIDKKALLKQIN
ncbi:MAG: AMP-binding protein [Fulvivirga sp.]